MTRKRYITCHAVIIQKQGRDQQGTSFDNLTYQCSHEGGQKGQEKANQVTSYVKPLSSKKYLKDNQHCRLFSSQAYTCSKSTISRLLVPWC